MKSYLTTIEAAEYLGIKLSTLYQMTHKRLIKFYKPTGSKNYFKKEELDEYMQTCAVHTDVELDAIAFFK